LTLPRPRAAVLSVSNPQPLSRTRSTSSSSRLPELTVPPRENLTFTRGERVRVGSKAQAAFGEGNPTGGGKAKMMMSSGSAS